MLLGLIAAGLLTYALAERARARRGSGARRRARVRGRAVPAGADGGRPSAGADLRVAAAIAVDVRARAPRLSLVARAVRVGDRLHPRVGPGASGTRRRAVLSRVCPRPLASHLAGDRRDRRRGARCRGRRARLAGDDRRLDRRGRPLAAPGRALLRRLARLRRPSRPPRLGDLRLPRLADPAGRHRGARPAHTPSLVRAGGPVRRRDARAARAGARHDDAHLRSRALRHLAASLPPSPGAAAADRLSCHRGTRRLRSGRVREGGSVAARAPAAQWSSPASPSSSCSPTCA